MNRLSTLDSAALSDALDACGIEGALLNIKPLIQGVTLFGPAFTVQYQPYDKKPETFKNASDYLDDVPAGSVIVLDNQANQGCSLWGDILTEVAIMKNIAGTVVNGAVRDVKRIRELHYPLFYHSITMRSGKNRVFKAAAMCPLHINGVTIQPGDFIFADDNGVLAIPAHVLTEVIEKANNICATEQRIITCVQEGGSLQAARKKYHYDTPWIRPHPAASSNPITVED